MNVLTLLCTIASSTKPVIGLLRGLEDMVVRYIYSYVIDDFHESILNRETLSVVKVGQLGQPNEGSLPVDDPIPQQAVEIFMEYPMSILQPKKKTGQISYLTIDERVTPGSKIGDVVCSHEVGLYFEWGQGLFVSGSVKGGIYMGSDVKSSTLFYDYEIKPSAVAHIPSGDVNFLRRSMGARIANKMGGIYWLTDRTPHESMVLEADTERSYVRVVESGISVWFKEHNTPNPLCSTGEGVMIIEGDKCGDKSVLMVARKSDWAKAIVRRQGGAEDGEESDLGSAGYEN
ncbi:hypothetical protein TrLO_g4579 [Triparma laevis f. longispina]|uniref:Uncharacterized protein n=1 Tax=Triparma laevis f. longispina TaxID=1714387 RepID=A0A9W7L0F4_9STRA|nr:hypothetical protein TrLO_g4579 [Triparma laevis f. longispina]